MTYDIVTLGLEIDASQVRDGDRALDDFQQTGAKAEKQVDKTNSAMDRMTRMAKAVAGAFAAIEIFDYVKEITLLASRYNELGIVMGVLGRNAGRSGAELAATEAALQKTGISALQSRDAIAKLISANIDLSKATDLARLAQDAAVIGGMNSSEAFERLIRGIQTAEKETLETMGLNVNFQKSYDALAKSLGKTANDLTTVEKTQAAVNAVMEKAPGIAGAYEASLTNAGKQMRSMDRYIENLKIQLGQPFQNPFAGFVEGATKALKIASENVGAIRSGMEATIDAILPVMKIAAAYFALFVAAPALYAAAAAALWPVISALAVYAMNVAIGQARTIGFNTSLFGTSVAAQLAAGSLTKLGLAANLLFALFAGWQIGEYLDKQFVQARVAGEVFAGAILEVWEHIKFGGIVAFDALTLAGRVFLQTMATLFAKWGETVAGVMRAAGATSKADQVDIFAGRIRAAADAQGTFASRTAAASAEHDKNLKVIRLVTESRVDAALKENMLSEATSGAATATAAAAKALAELTEAQKKAYADAVKNAKEYIESLQQQREEIGATESQTRMLAAAREAMKAPTAALRMQIMQEALALEQATVAWQEKTAAQERDAAAKKLLDDGVEAIWNQVRALQAEAEGYGKTAEAMAQAQIKKVQAQLRSAELSEDETRALEMQLAGLNALSTAQAKLTTLKGATSEPQKLLDVMEALESAAKSAGAGMADAFGSVGSAIGELTSSLATYARTQAAISKQLAEDEKAAGGDKVKLDKARMGAAQQSAQAQLRSYGDMAKAAKGFFKENTAGYRAMEGAEKAYRAFEMALAVKTMLEKSGLLAAFTGLFVSSKATETAATVASVGPDVAASQVKGQAAALAGVAGQAQGDPYSAWARMAAMAAVMAGLGFMVGGVGKKSDMTAKDRQAAAGTGSVLGDSSAKSQSIARAIELSANNSSTELNYTAAMLRALLAIQSSLSGLGNLLIRSGDVGGPLPGNQLGTAAKLGEKFSSGVYAGPLGAGLDKLTGGWISKTTGKIANSIFGGSVKAIDGGIMADKTTVGGVMAGGMRASSYVETKKDGGWFSSDKYRTTPTPLGPEANGQLTTAIRNTVDGVKEAGKLLGFEGDAFTQRLNAFTIDLGKISSKDLKPEEFQAQLEAVFSKLGDDMARWAVGGLASFQQVGEGYLETLVRVASNYANLDAVLHSVGMTFGAVGLQSIAAREDFIAAAGGMDELAGKFSSFGQNFLTEAQRLAPVQKYVTDQLAALGLAHLNSRDAFAAHLLALNPAIDAERKQIAALLDLAPAFALVNAQAKDLTKSQQDIADERADLMDQLADSLLSDAEKIARARAKLDPSNRYLFDQVKAAEAARTAQDAARESMRAMADEYRSFADSVRGFSTSLLTGSLSTLTGDQQLAELRRQYEQTSEAALGGDTAARDRYNSVAQAFLTQAQKMYGGDSKYSTELAAVLDMNDKLAVLATDKANVALAQLAAVERQANGIDVLNATMARVEQYLAAGASPSPIAFRDYGTANTEPLVAEVKALRGEMQGMRADNERLAALAARAGASAALAAAGKMVDGVGAALTARPRVTERKFDE